MIKKNKILLASLAFIILLAGIMAVLYFRGVNIRNIPPIVNAPVITDKNIVNEKTVETDKPVYQFTEKDILSQEQVQKSLEALRDSNNDGLSDEQARNMGLNPKKLDTDSDGIFDVDEINMTKTDPLKKIRTAMAIMIWKN